MIRGGFIDLFLPTPQAFAMVLWEFGHVWILVVGVALVRAKLRHRPLRPRDRILLVSMLASLLAGAILRAELLQRGVAIGVPGVDHSRDWWRR
jgi:formate-dependent nitrite reductase membrane component NrfD